MNTRIIPNAPFRNWSELKHGNINDFIRARSETIADRNDNFEQFQAFAVELAGLVTQLVSDPENGFSDNARCEVPVLKKETRRGIAKYGVAMKHWQEEILTADEREMFVSATFVWA